MPRLPIDYSKTIIYKICCNDVNIKEIYVGHTTDLVRRRKEHKYNCNLESKKEYDTYKYQFIRENGGWENWSLVPVEEFACENVIQATIRERYWIEELKAELNKSIPSRTFKEYLESNKQKINEIKKEYYENNKKIICEKTKKYRDENKEVISEKAKKKFTCECGSICRISDKAEHFKTKKHQKYLTTINKDRQVGSS